MAKLVIGIISLAAFIQVLMPVHAKPPKPVAQELHTLIDGLVAKGEPGVAVGIVIDGDIAFTHYEGLANLETPTDIGPKSRFNIASNAKQYMALMVLDLADQGRVGLFEDFRVYLPDAMPNVDQRITIEQLITHTSGVRDISELWGLTGVTWYERPFTNRDAMKMLNAQSALNFEPGTDFLYSNSNYILLSELVAEVTETPFPEYAEGFFSERRMQSTSWRRRYGVVVPNVARAYGKWSGWLEDPAIANMFGDGFLFTTLSDQLEWEKQVWGHEPTLPSKVMTASQRPVEGSSVSHYGFGLEFGRYKGQPTAYHVGSTGGYNAYTLRFPNQKTSIVVIGNTTQVGVVDLGNAIADRVLKDQLTSEPSFPAGPKTVDGPPIITDFLGLYELDSGTLLELTLVDGELYREIDGRDPVQLLPEGGNLFRYETIPELVIALTKDGDGRRAFKLYSPNQPTQVAKALDPAPAGDRYRRRLQGTFLNEETGTEIILRHIEADEFAMIKNGRERTATLKGNDYLGWNAYRFRAQRDRSGRVSGLMVDNNRIRNVWFERVD